MVQYFDEFSAGLAISGSLQAPVITCSENDASWKATLPDFSGQAVDVKVELVQTTSFSNMFQLQNGEITIYEYYS